MKEPRSDAMLKNLPDEVQEQLWQLIRPDDLSSDAMSVAELQAEIPLRHGFTIGLTALYEWRSWYGLRRRLARARLRAQQAELEAAQDGSLDAAAIARVGQVAFTSEAVDAVDVKAFVQLEKLRMEQAGRELLAREKERDFQLRKQALEQNERRIHLLEQAASDAKAKLEALTAKAKSKGGISEETLREIEEAAGLL